MCTHIHIYIYTYTYTYIYIHYIYVYIFISLCSISAASKWTGIGGWASTETWLIKGVPILKLTLFPWRDQLSTAPQKPRPQKGLSLGAQLSTQGARQRMRGWAGLMQRDSRRPLLSFWAPSTPQSLDLCPSRHQGAAPYRPSLPSRGAARTCPRVCPGSRPVRAQFSWGKSGHLRSSREQWPLSLGCRRPRARYRTLVRPEHPWPGVDGAAAYPSLHGSAFSCCQLQWLLLPASVAPAGTFLWWTGAQRGHRRKELRGRVDQ